MKEVRLIDSLNREAYAYRYRDLDSSFRAATEAYNGVTLYKRGKAEAANNLGFCAFMRMDFGQAERFHKEVYELTKNELERLIADIGLMKICQRTAMNKEFYDYRNSALCRMKRIAEDDNLFVDKHDGQRLNYARSEFHIVSAIYHHSLQQRQEAMVSIRQVAEEKDLATDTAQWLYYHAVKGAAVLCDGGSVEEQKVRAFDELYLTWLSASRKGYLYFEGSSLQGLASMMVSPNDCELFLEQRPHASARLESSDTIALRLGRFALQRFVRYGDVYQTANAYVVIGKYLNAHGFYEEALDTLQKAWACVGGRGTEEIREQMSVSYAGLGMKKESDHNRNVYLDILDDTRQDKELESRYQTLETEANQLNIVLLLVIVGFVLLFPVFVFFNKLSKERNKVHLHRLQLLLDICQKITSSIPADAQTEEEIAGFIQTVISSELEELFGEKNIRIEKGHLLLPHRMGKDEQAMIEVINPYIQWAIGNGMTSISLGDERRRLETQRYIHEQHIAKNKRQNLIKKTCMSIVNGIHPYIDRILREVKTLRGSSPQGTDALDYIDELVGTINEYNDILATWIKMKQGSLNLNIETFELNELFELIRKGSRTFEMKRQTLEVQPTELRVKADKALTLFMINTMTENARKYTRQGGTVKVYARQGEDYVEISVEDNGCGLSQEDVSRITGEKVYDSRTIGMSDAADKEELRRSKGSGFGLMNCKGIIEKYRKTNELFKVCLFDVESRLGEGSRFFFRLPGPMIWLVFCFSMLFSSCGHTVDAVGGGQQTDTVPMALQEEYNALLDSASEYANEAYFCNVDGEYEQALCYIDSAKICLNEHYILYADAPQRYMTLTGEGEAAELDWWNKGFRSDYHVILDIRNEAAVAFLALKQWEEYEYNNAAYTMLYKLLGEDRTLEGYCQQLERSTSNKTVGIVLAVMLLLAMPFGLYALYFRKRLVNRWNLEQVLAINEQVLMASMQNDEDLQTPRRIVDSAFDSVNELLSIDRLSIGVHNETTRQLEIASNPAETESAEETSDWRNCMERCFDRQAYIMENGVQALPLMVDAGKEHRCIGVLCISSKVRELPDLQAGYLLLELIARYVAVVVFNAVVKLATKYRDIEVAQEEARRASLEDSLLHVQNMVLDNCLSTIKHETVYYPNKVKQLIGRLRSDERLTEAETRETIAAIGELMEYYKGIFTILSSCATRQLEEVSFRRSVIPVQELMTQAGNYFRKAGKGRGIRFVVADCRSSVVGDRTLLCSLLENLIDEACSVSADGIIRLSAQEEGAFVRFLFTDTRREKSREELNQLFYPDLHHMEYLVCRQIIREHDEYAGRRGCRINAEPCSGGGFTVYFTVPLPSVGKDVSNGW